MNSSHPNRDSAPHAVSARQLAGSPAPTISAGKTFQRTIPILLAPLLMALHVPHAFAQRYMPTDIVAPEGAYFWANALNDSGQVCGSYVPPGDARKPAVWDGGAFTLLPLLPGTTFGTALGLNNVGQVVGSCSADNSTYNNTPIGDRACVWENGTVRELAAVAGATYSRAVAVNDGGTIVGQVYSGPDYDSFTEAVIWKGSTVAKLVPPLAGAETYAHAIDNSGRIAAEWVKAYSGLYAGRWIPNAPNGTTGTMEPLVSDASPHLKRAIDINNAGTICGETMVWYGVEGFELPFRTTWCHANGINDAGVVVGNLEEEESGFLYVPFVWDAQNGTRDLNTLLAASTPNAYPGSLESVLGLNNAGQILVRALIGQDLLLTPTGLEPPLAPPILSAWVNDSVIQLYWTSTDTGWSYRLKRSTVSGGPYTTLATIAEPITGYPNNYSYQDNSAVNGVRYYYVASAIDGVNESANSAEVSAIILAQPVAPSGLRASVPKRGGGVNLTWNQSTSPDVVANRIYRSANGGAFVRLMEINAGTIYQDTQVSRRTAYSYFVTAVNANGLESPASNLALVRTK